eukprot:g34310.t1
MRIKCTCGVEIHPIFAFQYGHGIIKGFFITRIKCTCGVGVHAPLAFQYLQSRLHAAVNLSGSVLSQRTGATRQIVAGCKLVSSRHFLLCFCVLCVSRPVREAFCTEMW